MFFFTLVHTYLVQNNSQIENGNKNKSARLRRILTEEKKTYRNGYIYVVRTTKRQDTDE